MHAPVPIPRVGTGDVAAHRHHYLKTDDKPIRYERGVDIYLLRCQCGATKEDHR